MNDRTKPFHMHSLSKSFYQAQPSNPDFAQDDFYDQMELYIDDNNENVEVSLI